MSFFGLGIAGNALSSFQEAANVTSDNISNLNTPGASRQVVNVTEAPAITASPFYAAHGAGTMGGGAVVASVTRVHDTSYDTLFRGATASQSYFQSQQQVLGSAESSFGEPNNGINTAYASLQTAFSTLAAQPTDAASRTGVISSAESLASKINAAAAGVQAQKTQIVSDGASVVTKANAILDQIGSLNGQIRASAAVGDHPNTFADQRDHLIDQLSQLVSTQTSIQGNGSTLVTVNGLALVNDQKVYHLAAPTPTTAADGSTVLTVRFEGGPNAANPTAISVGGGQLGGLIDVYNNKLTAYGSKLDNFANGLASEVNRITQAGYDKNGSPGGALFGSAAPNLPITANNLTVAISDPSLVPAALASTAAGTLVGALNAANNTVQTSAAIAGNTTLSNPPPAAPPLTGSLTVNVDGTSQTFSYSTANGGSAGSIDTFVQNFNNGHFGVSASFDPAGQRIVFSRDPNNVDATHRALAAGSASTASFSITDSLQAAPGSPAAGQPAASLLQALGAGALSGVVQNASNAYGSGDNGGANAVTTALSNSVGVPGYNTASTTAVAAAGTATVTLGVPLSQFPNIKAGDRILVDSAPGGNPETVVVTSVDRNAGTISAAFGKPHAAGFSVAAAPDQTLGSYYGGLVTQLGLDSQIAKNGVTSQTSLASSIDKARQGVDGINIDEETQNLLKYQNAYQAAAHVVSVLDSLLNTVITTIGARL